MQAELSRRLAKISGRMGDLADKFFEELPKASEFRDFSPDVQKRILEAEIQRENDRVAYEKSQKPS